MPNTTKTESKSKVQCKKVQVQNPADNISKLKAVQLSEIEDIQMLVTIKGFDYLLVPKPDCKYDAEITKKSALMLMLDHFQIMDPSIQELKKNLNEIMD